MKISAIQLAEHLGREIPTPEQIAIIEAPLEPALVVAGAGSGKTETMAARVVWLVANGHVKIHEVLGMTFTRKAAGELASRISERLSQLVEKQVVDFALDDMEQATVTTYNSFAHRIYNQYGLLIGRDPDSTVLGEAAAWQLARQICRDSDVSALSTWGKSLDQLTEAVLGLSHAIEENVAAPEAVRSYATSLSEYVHNLENSEGTSTKTGFTNLASVAQTLATLVELTQQYAAKKKQLGLIEFSDQVSLALEICRTFPSVLDDYRSQFKVILLDEYQDTSVVQAQLLATLFAGLPVMAVGDPHQSIYGWRGASTDNIEQFASQFAPEQQAGMFSLSTSWRNPVSVLNAANVIVAPLSEKLRVAVKELGPSEKAGTGELQISVTSTIVDEAAEVASWFSQRLTPKTSAALLCRSVKNISVFTQALDQQGVPYHVVGLGGLLEEPVIVDVVCMLRVLHDATADSELIRLLSGARWRIGTRDLAGLSEVASWLGARDYSLSPLDTSVKTALRESVVSDESASLVDAVDFIARTSTHYDIFNHLSEEGLTRIRDAGKIIARLRQRTGADLRDLVTLVQQELLVDIEAQANESAHTALSSLEAFMEPIIGYVTSENHATLGGFLSWLTEAEKREKLSPQSIPAEKGTVQIMTIHAAKGLEWDIVAVPRMVTGELPGDRTRAEHWVKFGQLPYEFRGDRAHLPVLGWRSAENHSDLETAFSEFIEQIRQQYDDEQRRLAYVALTRAKHSLLMSASFWSKLVKPRLPGVFLQELSAAGVWPHEIDLTPKPEKNPMDTSAEMVSWPRDPLGNRRQTVEHAANMVLTADTSVGTPWDYTIELLLAERRSKEAEHGPVLLPSRIASSKFKDFIDSPEKMAQALRRPLPERPYKATMLGTIFHQWVEQRSAVSSYPDEMDGLIFEVDGAEDTLAVDPEELLRLQRIFEASPWATKQPAFIEIPIELPLAGTIFSCKIDAIYAVEGPGEIRWQIVDWKTGKAPVDARDLELKQFQLALYRLAFSRLKNIPMEHIDAVFYFVSDDKEIRPEKLYSESELEERWSSSTGGNPR